MFSDIATSSNIRLIEVRDFLDYVKNTNPPPPLVAPNPVKIAKGLFFVHLYGAYEYTVHETLVKAISLLSSLRLNICDYKPLIYSIFLNSECDALATSTAKNKWEKRLALFGCIDNNSRVSISSDLMPTSGENLGYRQLENIWKVFSISEPILPRNEIRGRITELVDNRNYIAHGNKSPEYIGSLNTFDELYQKYNDVSELCTYIISVFDGYFQNRHYLS